jgi:DNA-binding winged helix-turn-helix (wHTH) protein/tetratricopeptide (TPR) repeat protein
MDSKKVPEATLYRYRFGSAEFNESRFELRVAGLVVDIEQKPLQVLALLLEQRGAVVSREMLAQVVWDGRITVDQVITNAIAKLRKALGAADGASIVTIPRMGYRISASIERLAAGTRLTSNLSVKQGEPVPRRDNFVFQNQLATSSQSEVWLARNSKTGEVRVYKFARDPGQLTTLKREATLYRVLRESLGERDDMLRIIDWNLETSPFYLESEFGGSNLAHWAEAQDGLAGLSGAARVELFLQIADAVTAAHAVGVLHKDLKPSNILISDALQGSLRIRVADFGSGRLLDPGRLEELGITHLGMTGNNAASAASRSGTPLYLAPELLRGDPPTVQSDLFALGLILYQLLAGDLRRPMASGWQNDIQDPLLAEDIAAATDGEPARRLAGVAELIHRLRCLEQRRRSQLEAGRAMEQSRLAEQRMHRIRARRPWMVAAFLLLVAGVGLNYDLFRDERLARMEAELSARRGEAANRFLTDDLLGAADLSGPGGAHNPTMRELLQRTSAALDARFAAEPDVKASIDLALGNAYFGLTDYPAAERHRRDAVRLLRETLGPASRATLDAQYQLSALLIQTNRLDEAATLLDQTDQLAGTALTEDSRLAFQAHWTRAGYWKLRMAAAKSLEEYARADRILRIIDPDDVTLLFRVRDGLSWCYLRVGRTDDAERSLHDLMTSAYPPERVGPLFWGVARIDYGRTLLAQGKEDAARDFLNSALQELRTALNPDHFFVGVVQNELGDLYVREGRWSDARESLSDAYRILRARSGEHGQATLIAGANLGIVDYRMGQAAVAVHNLSAVHEDLVRQLGESSPQAQSVAYYLAAALDEVGKARDAAPLAEHLTAADLDSAEPRPDWEPRLAALRGQILIGEGRRSEGRALLVSAVSAMEASHTPEADLMPFKKTLATLH